MIAYTAADLIWASRIKATAEAMGLSARPVRSGEMLRQRFADSDVRALVVDLAAAGLALELIRQVREREAGERPVSAPGSKIARVRVLAFGPHVEKALFQAARDAGADEVLPNGAFDRSMPDILLALETRAADTGAK